MLYFMEYEPEGRAEDRVTEHILGRRLLEYGLKEEYGRSYEVEKKEGGKPYLRDASHIYFNITHTKGIVFCAVSDRVIGVDAEYMRQPKKSLVERICSEEERDYIYGCREMEVERFTRIWTLKESYVKAIGSGLAFPLGDVWFRIDEGEDRGEISCNMQGWEFRQFLIGRKYVVSVCERKE